MFVGCHRTKFTTSISVYFFEHMEYALQHLYYLLMLMQGKLTRPLEAGAKADAEATKSNDTAAENFMVTNPYGAARGWLRGEDKMQ